MVSSYFLLKIKGINTNSSVNIVIPKGTNVNLVVEPSYSNNSNNNTLNYSNSFNNSNNFQINQNTQSYNPNFSCTVDSNGVPIGTQDFLNFANFSETSNSINQQNNTQNSNSFQNQTNNSQNSTQNFIPMSLSGTVLSIPNSFSVSQSNVIVGAMTISIKDQKSNIIDLQVKSEDLVQDIIDRYKIKSGLKSPFSLKKGSKTLCPRASLQSEGINNGDVIDVVLEMDENTKKKIEECLKKGEIPFIITSSIGSMAFFGKPDIQFKVFKNQYKTKFKNDYIFLYDGNCINDNNETKTIKELGIKPLSKIVAMPKVK